MIEEMMLNKLATRLFFVVGTEGGQKKFLLPARFRAYTQKLSQRGTPFWTRCPRWWVQLED